MTSIATVVASLALQTDLGNSASDIEEFILLTGNRLSFFWKTCAETAFRTYKIVENVSPEIGSSIGSFLISQLVWTACQILFYYNYSSLLSALESKDGYKLYKEFGIQTALQALCSAVWSIQAWLGNELSTKLKKSTAESLLATYLGNRLFLNGENDQTLSREITIFVDSFINAFSKLVFPAIRVGILSMFIAPVTRKLTLLLFLYGSYMFLVILYAQWDFDALERNRDHASRQYENALLRVESQAESLAFLGGENIEMQRIVGLSNEVSNANTKWLEATFQNDAFTFVNMDFVLLFPLVMFSQDYFDGKLDIAGIMYIKHMFYQTYEAVTNIPSLVKYCKGLYTSSSKLIKILNAPTQRSMPVTTIPLPELGYPVIQVSNLTVQFSSQTSPLIDGGMLTINRGEKILLVGSNGSGKTTLLRVLAQLLHSDVAYASTFQMIDRRSVFFLPQVPYMLTTASIRAQLLFPTWSPGDRNRPNDAMILQAIQDLELESSVFANTNPRQKLSRALNAERLSGGEKQLIGFARLLIAIRWFKDVDTGKAPVIAILDESSSALFPHTEAKAYQYVYDECETIVSVGHRQGLHDFHTRTIALPHGLK